MLRARHAEREIFLQWQRKLVDRERRIERDLPLEAGLRVLAQELHARLAGIEDKDGIRLFRLCFRELRGEIELIRPFGQFLPEDLAFERGRHATEHVLAGGIVRSDQKGRFHVFLIHVVAHRLWRLVVLP